MLLFTLLFYTTRRGESPIEDYIIGLGNKHDKDSLIKLQKIRDYIGILLNKGNRAGEPYIKHLDDDIWELRPLRDRILYAAWDEGCFILLHMFVKRTQETPRREIEQAKRNLVDFRERNKKDDKK
jgi:phage-related protein